MANLNEIQRMIGLAVTKGQLELMEMLYNQTVKAGNGCNNTVSDNEVYQNMLQVFGRVSHDFRKQLDHFATTEHTPLTANEMHPMIDDTPEDWDEGKCIHNYVKYHAQGMGDPVYICTACGKERS